MDEGMGFANYIKKQGFGSGLGFLNPARSPQLCLCLLQVDSLDVAKPSEAHVRDRSASSVCSGS